jgi:HAD superfamily hydrolase (TIGR01509 family)
MTMNELAHCVGFLFDWDGVVIDSSRQHEASWHLLADELGATVPPDFFKTTFGMRNQQIIPRWFPDLSEEEILQRGDRKEALYREILRREGISALAGVKDFLRAAQTYGIPCAVGSSTPRKNIETVIEMAGLEGLFSAVVCAEDVARGKPDPEVFVKGATLIGRAPAQCIVFEDAFVGIDAARAGGMKVVGIATTHPVEKLTSADLAVPSLLGIDPLTLAQQLGLAG